MKTARRPEPTAEFLARWSAWLVPCVSVIAMLLFFVLPAHVHDLIYSHSSLFVPVIPAATAFAAWRRRRQYHDGQAWGWVLAGMTGFLGYEAIWYVSYLLNSTRVMPLADLSNLVFAPLVLVGVLRATRTNTTAVEGRRRILDAAILTIAAATLLYTVSVLLGGGIKPVTTFADALVVLTPLSDLLTLSGLAWVWVRRDGRSIPGWTRIVGLALLIGLVADLWYALPMSAGQPSPWFVRAAWYGNWSALGIGAAQAMRPDVRSVVTIRPSRLPYVLAMACYGGLAVAVALHRQDAITAATIGVGAITFLVLTRQFLAMSDFSQMQSERVRIESNARLAALVRHGSDLLTIISADSTIRYASPSHEYVFGIDAGSLIGRSIFGEIHHDDLSYADGSVRRVLIDDAVRESYVVRMRAASGEWRWIESLVTNLLHEPAIGGLVVNGRDITERKVLEEQLREQALRDPLTGLGNRRLFADRMAHAVERIARTPETIAVLLLDLDHFKFINDSLGHAQGDALLCAVAERLRDVLRSADTVVRLGGDEFAILLENISDPVEADLTATRVQAALARPFLMQAREVTVRASIGIALASAAMPTDDLLTDADVAMYAAKSAGRGCTERYSKAMRARIAERHEVEADLRQALQRNEFRLLYQPIIDLQTGRIVGAEALIRWRHPEHGEILPDRFISVAEESGLIVDLGRFVLRRAAQDSALFRQKSLNSVAFRVAVNFSARQLLCADLVSDIAAALADAQMPGNALIMELTESVLAEDEKVVTDRLDAVQRLGVQVALDDFGTGYSALAYLRRFPIDILKVDKSFVSWVRRDESDDGVTRAILAMGQSLSMQTVAEGIETTAQLDWLRALGCTHGQGYLFSRPVPRGELLRLIGSWEPLNYAAPAAATLVRDIA